MTPAFMAVCIVLLASAAVNEHAVADGFDSLSKRVTELKADVDELGVQTTFLLLSFHVIATYPETFEESYIDVLAKAKSGDYIGQWATAYRILTKNKAPDDPIQGFAWLSLLEARGDEAASDLLKALGISRIDSYKYRELARRLIDDNQKILFETPQDADSISKMNEKYSKFRAEQREAEQKEIEEFGKKSKVMLENYSAEIRTKISKNWRIPQGSDRHGPCPIVVQQTISGDVLTVESYGCMADEAYRRAAEMAVLKSSPLPTIPDPRLFERTLTINFDDSR